MTSDNQSLMKALEEATSELERAKSKIAELELRLDIGEQLVNAGSFQMNWDTMDVTWSENNLRLYGVTEKEFGRDYQSITEFVHPDDRASFDATMAEVISTRSDYTHTHRIIRADGQIRHVRESATTLGGSKGKRFLGTTQDITELVALKSAEAELNAMVQLAGEIAQVGGWTVDLDSGTVEVTPVTAGLYDKADMRSMTLEEAFDYYTPDSSARLQSRVAHSIETGEGFDEVLTMVSSTRRKRVVRVIGRSVYDAKTKRVVGLRGAVQDITETHEVQAAKDRLTHFVSIAERLASVGGWRVDLDPVKITWSTETARIHGLPDGHEPSIEEAFGFYAPEYRNRIENVFFACTNDGQPFDEIMQIVTADGRRLWARAIGEPVRDASGKIIAIEGAFQDVTELVAAQTEATELSQRLKRTLEGMSDAFFLLDKDWRFSFVNSQAQLLLQRSSDDLHGKNIWEEFPEAVGSAFQKEYERAVAEGVPVRFTEYYPGFDSWFEVSAEAMASGLAVYFRDITERRAQEEQLRLLEAAVSRQNDILLITEAEPIDGPDGPRIVYVNDAFVRRTGFSREEAIGATPRILQGPKTQKDELGRIKEALQNWEPVRAELINYTKSGEEFWLELDIVPLADETGRYTHWIAIERDISDRKKAELDLQSKEERFRLVTKAAGTAIWDWDAVNGQLWWSEGLYEIFGHKVDPAGNVPTVWAPNVHPDDAARTRASTERLESGQSTTLNEKYRFRRADGSWAFVQDNAFALYDTGGKVIRILGSMTDITEQKRLEEQFLQAQKMETVGQLTGGVAHDFNNLLTVILGNAEILEEKLHDFPKLQRLARMSVNAAERGADLTGRLLAFSRKQTLQPKVLDVAQLVHGMDSLLRRALPENVEIEILANDGVWKIEADAGQLESALLNLAVNARDAMPGGGKLSIEVSNAMLNGQYVANEPDAEPGQYVMLCITDSGDGILPEHMDRVFEPFFTTKEVGQGSGLGLSMVYGFVKQSEGHIRVSSQVGKGTSIRIYFPRSWANEEPGTSEDVNRKPEGGSETILVVEDDAGVREHVVTLLEGFGYNVIQASSGVEAIDLIREPSKIDLLFTDVVMPGKVGGRELVAMARKSRPDLKVLFTSGYTERSTTRNGRLDDGLKLLSKPYRREQLAAKVREVLDE